MRKSLSALAAACMLGTACSSSAPIIQDSTQTKLTYNIQDEDKIVWKSKKVELSELENEVVLADIINRIAPFENPERQKILDAKKTVDSVDTILLAFLKKDQKPDLSILERALHDLQRHPRLENTKFTFIIPKSTSELVEGDMVNRQLGVVADIFYLRTSTFNFDVKFKSAEMPLVERFSTNRSFYFEYSFKLKLGKKGYSIEGITTEPLLVSFRYTLPSIVFSAATNFYAHQVTRPTVEHIVTHLNTLRRVYGRELTEKEKMLAEEYWREKQFMASYALSHLWMLDFGQKNLDIGVDEIRHTHIYPNSFDAVRNVAEKMGAEKFLHTYVKTPQLIFNPQL